MQVSLEESLPQSLSKLRIAVATALQDPPSTPIAVEDPPPVPAKTKTKKMAKKPGTGKKKGKKAKAEEEQEQAQEAAGTPGESAEQPLLDLPPIGAAAVETKYRADGTVESVRVEMPPRSPVLSPPTHPTPLVMPKSPRPRPMSGFGGPPADPHVPDSDPGVYDWHRVPLPESRNPTEAPQSPPNKSPPPQSPIVHSPARRSHVGGGSRLGDSRDFAEFGGNRQSFAAFDQPEERQPSHSGRSRAGSRVGVDGLSTPLMRAKGNHERQSSFGEQSWHTPVSRAPTEHTVRPSTEATILPAPHAHGSQQTFLDGDRQEEFFAVPTASFRADSRANSRAHSQAARSQRSPSPAPPIDNRQSSLWRDYEGGVPQQALGPLESPMGTPKAIPVTITMPEPEFVQPIIPDEYQDSSRVKKGKKHRAKPETLNTSRHMKEPAINRPDSMFDAQTPTSARPNLHPETHAEPTIQRLREASIRAPSPRVPSAQPTPIQEPRPLHSQVTPLLDHRPLRSQATPLVDHRPLHVQPSPLLDSHPLPNPHSVRGTPAPSQRDLRYPPSPVASRQPSVVHSHRDGPLSPQASGMRSGRHSRQPTEEERRLENSRLAALEAMQEDDERDDRTASPPPPQSARRHRSEAERSGAERMTAQEALAAIRTPRTSYSLSPSQLAAEVNRSHFHDEDLCVLLHAADDPETPDAVRKALRKAVKGRVKKLGLESEDQVSFAVESVIAIKRLLKVNWTDSKASGGFRQAQAPYQLCRRVIEGSTARV